MASEISLGIGGILSQVDVDWADILKAATVVTIGDYSSVFLTLS